MNILQVPTITENEVSKIKTPLYIFAVGNDVLYPADRLKKKAIKIFRSLKAVFLLKGGMNKTTNNVHDNSSTGNFISRTILKNVL